jgi:meiotically up-regulated gene 157 (Mug157) protein
VSSLGPLSKDLTYTLLLGNDAITQIFRVIWEQSQPTFDEDWNRQSYYNWTGGNGALSPAVPNGGNGEPKAYTGLVGTHHRPSDDLSVFGTLSFSRLLTLMPDILLSIPDAS